ncbi:MAG: glycosyltransferase [Planctomycetota bacterium]
MRILYHHRTASRDGQEVHISELIGALRGLGHEVRVVSPGGDESDAGTGEMGGHRGGMARLRALIPDALLPLAAYGYEVVFSGRVAREAAALRADFLYERHALRNRVGARAARRLGIPLLLEVNAPLAREEAAEGRLRNLDREVRREVGTLGEADAVLVVTEVLKRILVQDGVPERKIHVIQNGIAPDQFLTDRSDRVRKELGLEGRLVLGFVGFPRPWHGLERVVKSMAAAADGPLLDAVLLIGGEGPALEPIRRLAASLGIRDRVISGGVLNRAEIPGFIDSFDIALQPHATAYASPLKLFEYLARGVAVIAPRQENLEEVLTHGDSAVLFDPSDANSFSRELVRLAEDRALRERVGRGGRRRVIEGGFTWTRNAERIVELAKSLLEDRKEAAR